MATLLFAGAHQDDIELSMGCAVRAHLEARDSAGEPAHAVHVLIATTGENSGARAGTGLTKSAFSQARDDEARRAGRMLGVRFEDVHLGAPGAPRPPDGELTVAAAEAILTDTLTSIGMSADLWVKTHSNLPVDGVRHPDHVHLGQAAANLLRSGLIVHNGLRFYVEPYQLSAFQAAHKDIRLGSERASGTTVVQNALREYQKKDSAGGKYGIGYASVPDAFKQAIAEPTNWYHLPPA
jgi:LmbE family N-acetylglucosaminyl deacetylase